ncbi:MAG: hypothetical protein M3P51_15880, partial [Chloroflexota bacterium]|nr:hypothetical protein [Chloroflexota bacterium]
MSVSGLGHSCWVPAGRRPLYKMLVLVLLLTVLGRPATALAARPQQEPDALADHLPLLVRDVPDPASRAAVDAYDRARLLYPQDAAEVFSQAWKGLVVPPAARKDTEALRRLLLTSQWGQTPGVKAPKVSARALEALAQEPRNAGRLNNAAVALFMFGVSISYGAQVTSVDGVPVEDTSDSYIWGVQDSALWLLKETEKAFGPSRAVTLNQAYYNSVVPTSHYPLAPAIADAQRWLAVDPTDRTARLLLANLQSRQADAPDALEQAVRTLAPLLEDGATAPLGHTALGDAYLASASLRQPEAPFLARELAERALEEYDRSLALRPGPGPHAGRAAALDLLGETQQAIAAQTEAVKLTPESVAFLLDLATLQEKVGDARGMQGSARRALDLTMNGWNPPLREVRLLTSRAPGGTVEFGVTAARSYLGFSVGSGAPHAGVWRTPQGGGYILVDDAVPRTNDRNVTVARRTGFTPDQAALTAISAALLLRDEQAALEAAELWLDRFDTDPALAGNPTYRQTRDAAVITAYWGAYLAANPDPKEEFYANVGEDPTTALWFAQNELRRAGKFADAARLCRAVSKIPVKRRFSPAAVQQCLGESASLAGDYSTAAEALGRAARASEAEATRNFAPLADSAVLLHVRAAAAAQAMGNEAAALQFLRRAATDDSADPLTSAAAFNELGDLALDRGDP